MTLDIKAPVFPESVADGEVATWHKQPGESVDRDELLVDIETDKVVLEVFAPEAGTLTEIIKEAGATVVSGEVIAHFEPGGGARVAEPAASRESQGVSATETPAAEPVSEKPAVMSPAARKLVETHGLVAEVIEATGKGGRLTKEDVLRHIEALDHPAPATEPEAPASKLTPAAPEPVKASEEPAIQPAPASPAQIQPVSVEAGPRAEKRVPMSRLRASIAKRLVSAQQNAAMLTTFNEVNMGPVMAMRRQYREQFEAAHDGARLGFMSVFVKAATEALKRFPAVNASMDGQDIVYHGYQDIGVAVSSPRGLVVPVLRDCDGLGLADIETRIADFSARAKEGSLGIEDMTGGTFTISNGGVFGSLMSTPILNPPQTAILGMHKIQDRPMAVDGQVVILPMMYLALSYDHRMIDGKEAVSFLVTIKDFIEDPIRMLLDV